MTTLIELKKEEYEEFVSHHEKSHFLQSYAWGEFAKVCKGVTPFYLGLVDESENILAATLLLKKALPLGYSYFYAPRGFIIDFFNQELLEQFTSYLKIWMKPHHAIFLKIDPDLIYKKINWEGKEIPLDYDPDDLFRNLYHCGFKHQGFTKNFETMQPRYTFRIDLTKDLETLTSHFSKTTNQRIQKAIKLNTQVEIGTSDDIETFYQLMLLTENRKDFVSHDLEYYQKLYDIYNKDNHAILFLGKVDVKQMINDYEQEKEQTIEKIGELPIENLSKSQNTKKKELIAREEQLKKEIEKLKSVQEEYGDTIVLNAHMIFIYQDKAWVLYAGNHNVLSETYSNYHTYFEHIKYCKEHKVTMYDQFGTIGDIDPNNPRYGLHEFKKKFGGDYIEFLGEFDLKLKPVMYFVFTKLVPFYRNHVKTKAKKEIKKEDAK